MSTLFSLSALCPQQTLVRVLSPLRDPAPVF